MAQNRVSMYCVKDRHRFTAINPQVVTLKAGRNKIRMRAYRAPCPKHPSVFAYRFIGRA